jgi:hypothetical protein
MKKINRNERREHKDSLAFSSLRSLRSLRLNDHEAASTQARVRNHPVSDGGWPGTHRVPVSKRDDLVDPKADSGAVSEGCADDQ